MKYWKKVLGLDVDIGYADVVEKIETERLTRESRARRDNLLKQTVDSVNPMRWEALTELQKDAWRAYRQALLDVPQQEGFPTNIVWQEAPHV